LQKKDQHILLKEYVKIFSHMEKYSYGRCFKTLSSPLRLRIIKALCKRPMSVTELSHELRVERSKVSHALLNLKNCSFVRSERKGRQNIYSLTKSILHDIKVKGNLFEIIAVHVKKHCKSKIKRCTR